MSSLTPKRRTRDQLRQTLLQRERLRRSLKTLVIMPEPDSTEITQAINQLLTLENKLSVMGHKVQDEEAEFDRYIELAQSALQRGKRLRSPETPVPDKEAKLEPLKLSSDTDWPFFKARFATRYAHCSKEKRFELLRQACSQQSDITTIDRYFADSNVEDAFAALAEKYEDEGRILNQLKQKLNNISSTPVTAKSPEKIWAAFSDVVSWCSNVAEQRPTLNLLLFESLHQKLDTYLQTELFLTDTSRSLNELDSFVLKWYKAISLRENSSNASSLSSSSSSATPSASTSSYRLRTTYATPRHRAQPPSMTLVNSPCCIFCSGTHASNVCRLSIHERKQRLSQNNRCFNCLTVGHPARVCRNPNICHCGGKHSSLLCVSASPSSVNPNNNASQNYHSFNLYIDNVMSRAVLDSLSSVTLISRSIVPESLIFRGPALSVQTVNRKPTSIGRDMAKVHLTTSPNSTEKFEVCAYVVDTLHHLMIPVLSPDVKCILKEQGIFVNDHPGPIQLLIGMDYLNSIIIEGSKKVGSTMFAIPTKFGWTVSMSPNSYSVTPIEQSICSLCIQTESPQEILEDEYLLNYYNSSIKFEEGRYSVRFPFLPNSSVNPNYNQALQQLDYLERRLKRNNAWTIYNNLIQELITRKTVHIVDNDSHDEGFYLPHHCVERPEHDTTKYRIVFNGSSEVQGISLNTCLFKGVTRWNLKNVLFRFREKRYAVTADIEKAFHTIALDNEHRKYVKFLWKIEGSLATLQFCRVPFGLSCSPFLLFAVIQFHLSKYMQSHPVEAEILQNCMYVDDLAASFSSKSDVVNFKSVAIDIFKSAGMNLRKWSCDRTETSVTTVLGLNWNINRDSLQIQVPSLNPTLSACPSKRSVASVLSSIYDPLGLVTPVTLPLKKLLRDIWISKLDWDDPLPDSLASKFRKSLQSLETLKTLEVPRALTNKEKPYNLVLFTDASSDAIGCVAYIEQDGQLTLLTSKQRLVKVDTIPNAELKAIRLASNLANTIKQGLSPERTICFSDSLINVKRLQSHVNKYSPKIGLQLLEITKHLPDVYHVVGPNNPADLLTKVRSKPWLTLWLSPKLPPQTNDARLSKQIFSIIGPRTYFKSRSNSAKDQMELSHIRSNHGTIQETLTEFRIQNFCPKARRLAQKVLRNCHVCVITSPLVTANDFFKQDYAKMLAVMETMQRKDSLDTVFGQPILEMDLPRQLLIWAQQDQFGIDEYQSMKTRGKPCTKRSYLYGWKTRFDNGLIRVETAIRDANEAARVPILLLGQHPFTRSLIKHEHEKSFHLRQPFLSSQLRNSYYIIGHRNAVNQVLSQCYDCAVKKKRLVSTSAGVPISTPSSPFEAISIDFAGPITIKGRKRYILIIVDLYSRFICAELTKTLISKDCEWILRSVFARYGWPKTIYSDNGRTFVGLRNKWLSSQVDWKFLPPYSPWLGGTHERAVQTVKRCLQHAGDDRKLSSMSDHDVSLILLEITSFVNDRPLTYFSTTDEALPLTPARLMFGREIHPSSFPPSDSYQSELSSSIEFYRNRYYGEYLLLMKATLQNISNQSSPPSVGDWAILKDITKQRSHWPVVQIVNLLPSTDNEIRLVKVQGRDGDSQIVPCKNLVLIPRENDNQ